MAGSGFFARGKFEPLGAYAYSINGKQHLILLSSSGTDSTSVISISLLE